MAILKNLFRSLRRPTPTERCPCCGFKTLTERNMFEICQVCFWEDDGQDNIDADEVKGGPNGDLSLTEARRNYQRIGAVSEEFVACVSQKRQKDE